MIFLHLLHLNLILEEAVMVEKETIQGNHQEIILLGTMAETTHQETMEEIEYHHHIMIEEIMIIIWMIGKVVGVGIRIRCKDILITRLITIEEVEVEGIDYFCFWSS